MNMSAQKYNSCGIYAGQLKNLFKICCAAHGIILRAALELKRRKYYAQKIL